MNENLKLETTAEGIEWWVFKTRSKLNRRAARLTREKRGNTVQRMDAAQTTTPGYVNRNGQRVVRATELPGTDHNQRVYVLQCGNCGTEYGANGSDIFQRLCPACQGGSPGCPSD
jgi:hypothetical protein